MLKSLESSFEPWEIFEKMSSQLEEGFFIDNWGSEGVSYFGFTPQQSISGQVSQPEEPRLQNSLREMIQQSQTWGSPERFPFEGGVLSLIGYNCGAEFESFPDKKIHSPEGEDYLLALYSEVFIYQHETGQYYLASHSDSANLHLKHWELALQGLQLGQDSEPVFQAEGFRLVESSETYQSWVRKTVEYIGAGDIFQANLAHPLEFSFSGSPLELYGRMRQHNPSPYGGVYFKPGMYLVSNSPELLYSQKGSRIVTRPIAGTRPRSEDLAVDEANRAELFLSEKEQAEHIMLVDLERNDLGRVSKMGSVQVEELMVCEAYQNVFHIVSQVVGELRPELDAVDVLRAVFPGGTITGAPKIRSMEIIDELETQDRAYYTGSMGWFGPSGDAVLNILIRSLNLQASSQYQGRGRLHVGAGVVADSIAEKEFSETLAKAGAWMKFLGQL